MPLDAAAAEDLEYWIYNPDWPITGHIFLHIRTGNGKPSARPLQAVGIHDTLHRLADLAGVARFNPNDLRRTRIAALLAGHVGALASGYSPDHRLGDSTSTRGPRRLNAHIAAMTRPITDPTADTASGPAPKKPRRIHPAPRRDDPPIRVFRRPRQIHAETGARTGPNCLIAMHKHTALRPPSDDAKHRPEPKHSLPFIPMVTLKHRD